MNFDPENNVIKLCAAGMGLEGEGKNNGALQLFNQAWTESTNDFERFTSAHYIARHQHTIPDKLKWDELALNLALKLNDENLKGTYPSLYLNIAKCFEDLQDFEKAKVNYELALSFSEFLPNDGYGKMIKDAIRNGMDRIEAASRLL